MASTTAVRPGSTTAAMQLPGMASESKGSSAKPGMDQQLMAEPLEQQEMPQASWSQHGLFVYGLLEKTSECINEVLLVSIFLMNFLDKAYHHSKS